MPRLAPAHFAMLASLVLFGACKDGGTSPNDNDGTTPSVVSSVVISVFEVTLTSLGDTLTLTAEARDASGNSVSGKSFTWTSSNKEVATVSTNGLVTAVAKGSATITATTDGVGGSAAVQVAQAIAEIVATPDATALAVGETITLSAEATDARGNGVEGVSFTWQSSNESVATVDAMGVASAVAPGTATITATSGDVSGSATVSVLTAAATSLRNLTSDALVVSLLAGVSDTARDGLAVAVEGVLRGLAEGDVAASQAALADARTIVGGAATGNDVVFFAVLDLVFDYFEEVLNTAA